ncbi:MAG: hydrogenase/urease maturation nickel metallochaperone HypA [Candidatus Dormibacteria bacterium]|jgi:Zn finger protein HypA/HybF involved in hydrogenase expression
MHELSLVTELVAECVRRAGGRQVVAVQVRCPDGVDAGELTDAFRQLTAGGALADAALEIETVRQVLTCECGFAGEVDPEQCAGHMVVCPACSRVHEAPDALELITVRFPDEDPTVL